MGFVISRQALWVIFIVSGMLITGTINTIVKKVQNGWMAPGIVGRMHKVRFFVKFLFFAPCSAPHGLIIFYLVAIVQCSLAAVLLDVFG